MYTHLRACTHSHTLYAYHSCRVDVCGRVDVDISYDLRFEFSVPSQSLLVPDLVESQIMSVGIYGSPKITKYNWIISHNDVKNLKLTTNLVMKIYTVQLNSCKLTSDLSISSDIHKLVLWTNNPLLPLGHTPF